MGQPQDFSVQIITLPDRRWLNTATISGSGTAPTSMPEPIFRACWGTSGDAPLIRTELAEDTPLPVGLWLSRESLDDALRLPPGGLRRKIEEMGLQVFTLNGFPYGNFHDDRVKHDVYQPDWSRPERLRYTTDLADVLIDLVPEARLPGSRPCPSDGPMLMKPILTKPSATLAGSSIIWR